MAIPFDNSYVTLPESFYTRLDPTPVDSPGPIWTNAALAEELGIDPDWLASDEGVAVVAGNVVPEGAEPLAAAYAGHQFGSFNPGLGDGRAILLGEVISKSGERFDIQLKGSGRTPYSRSGDGRSPLGPVLRETIVSEAMHALGVPTTRALAAVTTGEPVYRSGPLPGAVMARVARSHIRVGTVQLIAARGDVEDLQALVDHVLARHYPELAESDNPALALLDGVVRRQAALIARWQMLGFIHGVMNTDNMLLSGETIDYGPCAFMERYDPATVFSSIDFQGRYAYRNQPGIAQWNLSALAGALVPLIDKDEEAAVSRAKAIVGSFAGHFHAARLAGLRRKLGLLAEPDGGPDDDPKAAEDLALAEDFLEHLTATESDFTLAFRRLTELAGDEPEVSVKALFDVPSQLDDWLARWRVRLEADAGADPQARMLAANPLLIPRNHEVERAIVEATRDGDFGHFQRLCELLKRPFDPKPEALAIAAPATPEEAVTRTFCGT